MSSGLFSPLVALRRTRELSLLRGSVYFCPVSPSALLDSLLNASLDFHIPISSFMGKMVFSEENGDFWGGFCQGSESQETLLLRRVKGKTARAEPDTGAGCGARTSEKLKKDSSERFFSLSLIHI